MEISEIDKVDIMEHFDKKVDEIVNHQRRWKTQAIAWIVIMLVALISSGYINAKAIGSIQTKTEILWKEYVPGDLFLAVIHSFDLQNRYTLSLLNGNREGAEKAYREFIEFRDQIYKEHFRTRGDTPTEGRIVTKQ